MTSRMGQTTKVKATLVVRGGFKSKRGTYRGYRVGESTCDGYITDSSNGIIQALDMARGRLQGDEVAIEVRVELLCVLTNEKE